VKLQLVLGEGSSLVVGEGGFFVAASVHQPTELLDSITFKTFFHLGNHAEKCYCPRPTEILRGKENFCVLTMMVIND
jgi:hypothetical protein